MVLHSEVVYTQEDMNAMLAAGLSEKEIAEITGNVQDISGHEAKSSVQSAQSANVKSEGVVSKPSRQPVYDEGVVIPSNPNQTTRIDYELTYYVNDINTANAQVMMTYGRNDSEKAVYTYGNGRIAEDNLQTGTLSDYLYDGRGSVVQTVANNEIDLSLTYDPFGTITSGADENFVGFAYNGEESNEVTGLQYLRARYYNTELGSFLTMDSYLGSVSDITSQNRYTYANNNPVNNIDPSGHYSVNVNGTMQYYQSTGLNEIRDYMTAAALWAGQVNAQNGFNRSVATAQNTSMFRYQSITGISQATANSYIYNGIGKAGQVSMNYGCSVPTLGNQAIVKFANNVNAAKNTANTQISNIKANKKAQYDAYVAYQAWLAQQRRLAEQRRLAQLKVLAAFNLLGGQIAQKAAVERFLKLGMGPISNALQYLVGIPARAQAQSFINQYFEYDFTEEDFNNLSDTQQMEFLNGLSKSISAFTPNLTVSNPSFAVPLGNGTSIYYQVSTTADLNHSDIASINLALQNQKLVFGDFSAQTGIGTIKLKYNSGGEVAYTGSNSFGNNTANLEFKFDTLINKTNAEFYVSSDLGNNIGINSIIGLEKQNTGNPKPRKQEENTGWDWSWARFWEWDWSWTWKWTQNVDWNAVGATTTVIGMYMLMAAVVLV